MKIKVYGWDGRKPDRSTFETFDGDCSLAVVLAMMATPYASNLKPRDFMLSSLAALARTPLTLPQEEALAADAYLSQLAALGLTEPA